MKLRITTILCSIFLALNAWGFGKVGHDAVAYIAECHLTPTAKANIEKYLGGKSIVYYASWTDDVRLQPAYEHTGGWHSASVDSLGKHKLWKPRYYAYVGINELMDQMEDGGYKQMSDSAVAVGIKLLVHIVGDFHCPSHTFIEGDRFTQNRYFYVNGDKYKFHKFWDSELLNRVHKWYYTDYQYQLDRCTPEQIKEIQSGSLIDWIEGNAAYLRHIYDIITPERHFDEVETSYFLHDMTEIEEHQILYGGYRVAHVLNSIFDPDYPRWER